LKIIGSEEGARALSLHNIEEREPIRFELRGFRCSKNRNPEVESQSFNHRNRSEPSNFLGQGSRIGSLERIWIVRDCEVWEEASLKLETPEAQRAKGPE
jgi:hypothetical protein